MKVDMLQSIPIICIGLLVVSTALGFAAGDADMILYNGKVITVDPQDQICQAVAIKDGKILAVGDDQEITPLAGLRCTLINLNGKTVTPGLIDSHYHLMYYGAQFWPGYLNIRHPVVTSKAELLQVVGDYAQQLSPGEWISGNQGFALQPFETVDRWDLDTVTPNNPAYLRHSSGQYSLVNSAALDSAGIDSSTANPPASLIMKDENGQPTGILSHYPAENLVGQHATGYGDRTDEQKLEDIERGQQLCFEAGYTSVQDVIVGSVKDIMLYKQFADSGRLKVRLYALLYIDYEQEADTLAKVYQPIDSDRFHFAGWKLAMDGGIAACTTLLYDKSLYASQISYPYHSQDEMNRIVQTLHNTGLQVAVHVAGDEGIDMTLTAFEAAMAANPRPDPRHRIEHGLFPTTSALQRMKNADIILSTQPQWISWYSDGYAQATDQSTISRLLPLKTMLDNGIHLAFGCDVPASPYQEPKWAFHGAVMRRNWQSGTIYNQSQKLTIQEALRVHTMGSAYAGFAEDSTGSLEVGKCADLVVWSHDLYTMQGTDLMDLASEMTIVDGEIVYDAGTIPVVTLSDYWLPTGDMLHVRVDHSATVLKNGNVLIVGWDSNEAELYEPASGTFTTTGSTIANHRNGSTATLLNDGNVLIVGGDNAQQVAELYNPDAGSFSQINSPLTNHSYHTATLLFDGRVLIAGGQHQTGPQTHAVCEIYDPLTGAFSRTDSLNVDRSGHCATLLPNEQVLISGGIQTTTPGLGNFLNSCELYDPASGTFSLVASMNQPRASHEATLLRNGKVLISGGAWYARYGELYDYTTNSWTNTGDMIKQRRSSHTATLLPNGRILLAGGSVNANTASAEIYDPESDSFSAVDSMITSRQQHTATLLSDGNVLVTGGYSGTAATQKAELFIDGEFTVAVGRDQRTDQRLPYDMLLSPNYPNPFNPLTHISYRVPSSGKVRISIYNVNGQLIRTLLDVNQPAGQYHAIWNGIADDGRLAATGVYLLRLETAGRIENRKMLFMK